VGRAVSDIAVETSRAVATVVQPAVAIVSVLVLRSCDVSQVLGVCSIRVFCYTILMT